MKQHSASACGQVGLLSPRRIQRENECEAEIVMDRHGDARIELRKVIEDSRRRQRQRSGYIVSDPVLYSRIRT